MSQDRVTLDDLRSLLMENCMLNVEPEEIQEDTALFGPGSLGLDSIDALQITVAVEQKYGVPIKDPAVARQVLVSLGSLQAWLQRSLAERA